MDTDSEQLSESFSKNFNWNQIRAAAGDCLNATWSMVCFGAWSQDENYDVDRAAAHLKAIEKACETFKVAMEILQPGLECSTDDRIRHSPVFDSLAIATAQQRDRPNFRYGSVCYATAHEAAFELLRRAILRVENRLNDELDEQGLPDDYVAGIDDLHKLSLEDLRETLSRLERKKSIQKLFDGRGMREIRSWIDLEWAAVSGVAVGEDGKWILNTTKGWAAEFDMAEQTITSWYREKKPWIRKIKNGSYEIDIKHIFIRTEGWKHRSGK